MPRSPFNAAGQADIDAMKAVVRRIGTGEVVPTREVGKAAIVARRYKYNQVSGALAKVLARRMTLGEKTSVVGGVVLSKKEQDRLYKNLQDITMKIQVAAAGVGAQARAAGKSVGLGLGAIGLAIFGAALVRRHA